MSFPICLSPFRLPDVKSTILILILFLFLIHHLSAFLLFFFLFISIKKIFSLNQTFFLDIHSSLVDIIKYLINLNKIFLWIYQISHLPKYLIIISRNCIESNKPLTYDIAMHLFGCCNQTLVKSTKLFFWVQLFSIILCYNSLYYYFSILFFRFRISYSL